jgi:PAS domain S-box-containing protein
MVPLRHQFNSVGVLKVVSTRPRAFDEPDIQALQMVVHFMATAINQVVALGAKQALLAEHSRTIVAFRESEARFRNAFDHAAIGMALMAVDGCWMKANQVLCRILGYDEEELRKLIFQTRVHPEDVAGYLAEADRLRAGEKGNFQMELRYLHKNGATLWILLSVSMLRDAMGDPLHLIAQIQDITEKKHAEEQVKISLREKDFLLKEIHHRVKNNLQVISSLLSLQSGYIRDGEILELFRESQNRVRSMALIHEKLYQSQDLGQIDFGEYVLNLVSMLFHSYRTHSGSVKLETRIDPVFLNIDTAIPVGLLINELVSNSLKYAFPAGRSGTIFIELRAEANQQFTLCFRDDGIGVPEEFDLDKTGTLGLRLVKILTSQIGGELAFHRNGGTQFVITFREQKDKDKQQSHGEPTSSGS